MWDWPSPANLGRKFQVGVLQPGLEKVFLLPLSELLTHNFASWPKRSKTQFGFPLSFKTLLSSCDNIYLSFVSTFEVLNPYLCILNFVDFYFFVPFSLVVSSMVPFQSGCKTVLLNTFVYTWLREYITIVAMVIKL